SLRRPDVGVALLAVVASVFANFYIQYSNLAPVPFARPSIVWLAARLAAPALILTVVLVAARAISQARRVPRWTGLVALAAASVAYELIDYFPGLLRLPVA